jgi:hypothetical protein
VVLLVLVPAVAEAVRVPLEMLAAVQLVVLVVAVFLAVLPDRLSSTARAEAVLLAREV